MIKLERARTLTLPTIRQNRLTPVTIPREHGLTNPRPIRRKVRRPPRSWTINQHNLLQVGVERFELSLERILSHAASACWATHPKSPPPPPPKGGREERQAQRPQHRGRHPHPSGSETPSGKTKRLLITESRNTTPPGREPEPHRSVTFPWPGITPQRSTRGATRDRDSNTQLNARDNHRASRARLKTIRDRSRRGRRPHRSGTSTTAFHGRRTGEAGAKRKPRRFFDLLPLRYPMGAQRP